MCMHGLNWEHMLFIPNTVFDLLAYKMYLSFFLNQGKKKLTVMIRFLIFAGFQFYIPTKFLSLFN